MSKAGRRKDDLCPRVIKNSSSFGEFELRGGERAVTNNSQQITTVKRLLRRVYVITGRVWNDSWRFVAKSGLSKLDD